MKSTSTSLTKIVKLAERLASSFSEDSFKAYLPLRNNNGQVELVGQGELQARICLVSSLDSIQLGEELGKLAVAHLAAQGITVKLHLYPERDLTPREQTAFFAELVLASAAPKSTGNADKEYQLVITNSAPILRQGQEIYCPKYDGLYVFGGKFSLKTLGADAGDLYQILVNDQRKDISLVGSYTSEWVNHALTSYSLTELTEFKKTLWPSYHSYLVACRIEELSTPTPTLQS